MAQLADEYTPERDSYQTRARPTPVRRAAPSPTLPPWVQARLKEQAQTEARRKTVEAVRAKEAVAQARREAEAFDRLAAVNLRALVPKPAAKQSKTVSRAPKALPVAQFRSPTFDELAAPRVPVRPTPRPAPTAPVGGPPPRDTPEYYAYLKGVINGTTQGIAPGVGSFSDAGEPARRTESTRPRPFSLLSNQDDELAAARVPVRSAPPSAGSGSASGAPPRGTAAYYAYLNGVINGTTQGIAPGVGSFSDAGEPARRTESPRPRPFSLLSNQDDELAAAQVAVGPALPSIDGGGAAGVPPRGTPAYDAYLKGVINGTRQGIAPGVGSYSEAGEPARRDGAPELTLAQKLRDGFVPGSGARPAVNVTDESSGVGPPPRDTPEYYAYLKGVINGTTQGIAPGVGSYSEAGEPARRSGAPELTLAQKLADGLVPGSGRKPQEPRSPSIGDLSVEEKRLLRNMEREPVSGPGARMFEMRPDEEAFWAAISPDESVSEEALAILRQDPRIPLTDEQVAIVEGLSGDADRRGQAIGAAEAAGRWDKADALRAGAPLAESESFGAMPGWLGDTARWIAGAGETAFTATTEGQQAIDEAQYLIPSEVAVDAIGTGLETMGEEGAEALAQFQSELAEWPELTPKEMIGRVHQAALGGVVSFNPLNPLQPFDWGAAAEGFAGNREYRGADHWLLRELPARYREPLGELLEDATHPGVLAAAGITLAAAPVTLTAVGLLALSVGVGIVLFDLDTDDPDSVALLEAFGEDLQSLLDGIDPDGEIRRQVNPSALGVGEAVGGLSGGGSGSW